jgi:hypothetical protein
MRANSISMRAGDGELAIGVGLRLTSTVTRLDRLARSTRDLFERAGGDHWRIFLKPRKIRRRFRIAVRPPRGRDAADAALVAPEH